MLVQADCVLSSAGSITEFCEMDHKGVLLSALGVGISLGMGLGLVSGEAVKKYTCSLGVSPREIIEEELKRMVISSKEIKLSFDEFPCYLSAETVNLLRNSAFMSLHSSSLCKHMQNSRPPSNAILLYGPNETYVENLAKALAREHEARLLLLDLPEFFLKMLHKNGFRRKESVSQMNDHRTHAGCDETASCFDDKTFFDSLYGVLISESSRKRPVILFVHRVLNFIRSQYELLCEMVERLPPSVLVMGSGMSSTDGEGEMVSSLFATTIRARPPDDEPSGSTWRSEQERDAKLTKLDDDRKRVAGLLATHDLECDDLSPLGEEDAATFDKHAAEIITCAVSHHLMSTVDPQYRHGRLVLSSNSLFQSIGLFGVSKDVTRDDEYEEALRSSSVVVAKDIGVGFADIGSMDSVKTSLREAVMLPLNRPLLFAAGGLLRPCRGVLLFGPPGTGKTMLAKAVASESGAAFINVSVSSVTSQWYGDGERNVRALFTLASKLSPSIIFVDEADALLGQRGTSNENEASRNIKNEFMVRWDGLLTRPSDRILVLAATNRPFDLDDAVIRRFERRIMVGLPEVDDREKIVRKLLEKVRTTAIDYAEIAAVTRGFSGCDLKNFCSAAAYRPVKELARAEKDGAGENAGAELRPVNMDDMRVAIKMVAPSFSVQGAGMKMLRQWNDRYGDGGSKRKDTQFSYFV